MHAAPGAGRAGKRSLRAFRTVQLHGRLPDDLALVFSIDAVGITVHKRLAHVAKKPARDATIRRRHGGQRGPVARRGLCAGALVDRPQVDDEAVHEDQRL